MAEQQATREAALHDLLTAVFDGAPDGLLQWVRLRFGKAVHDELPVGVGLAELAFDVVLAVGRHGLGNAALFDALADERPYLEARIREVEGGNAVDHQQWLGGYPACATSGGSRAGPSASQVYVLDV